MNHEIMSHGTLIFCGQKSSHIHSGLWQDKMDKKCFLGVNFSTCSNHDLFSTML